VNVYRVLAVALTTGREAANCLPLCQSETRRTFFSKLARDQNKVIGYWSFLQFWHIVVFVGYGEWIQVKYYTFLFMMLPDVRPQFANRNGTIPEST